MRHTLLTFMITGMSLTPSHGKNLAQELMQEQYDRLTPKANRSPEDEIGLAKFGPSHGGEEVDGDMITKALEDEQALISIEEYLTGLPREEIETEEIFLITGSETMDGQRKLKLNPKVLEKINVPAEKEKTSWWDNIVSFFTGLFA